MKKKLLSLIMAVAMIASLAVPALASTQSATVGSGGGDGYGATTTMGGQTRAAIVDVTLPAQSAANKIILNPYELKLLTSGAQSLGSGDSTALGGKVSPQVITVPMEIKSQSDVPLMVGVTAKATAGSSEVKVVETSVDQSLVGTDKNVFLYMDMIRNADGAAVSDWTATTAPKWHDDPTKVNTTAYSQVIPNVSANGAKAEKLFVIPAGDGTSTNAKYAYFKVLGSTAPDPKKDWATTDTVSVEFKFTFTPTKVYPIQAHKEGSQTAVAPDGDYRVAYGDTPVTNVTIAGKDNQTVATYAAAGTPVVVKAKDKYVFTSVLVVKPDDSANGIKEENETKAADVVKISDDTYYFIMPADKNGVVIRAGVESAT